VSGVWGPGWSCVRCGRSKRCVLPCRVVWVGIAEEELRVFLRESAIERGSSPGLPWMAMGMASVGEVVDDHLSLLTHLVNERMSIRDQHLHWRASPSEYVISGLRDCASLFIKNELHGATKLETGRLRLIFAVGFTDTVVERLMLGPLYKKECANWQTQPNVAGFGLTDDMCADLRQQVGPDPVDSDDMSYYDWCFTEALSDSVDLVHIAQLGIEPDCGLAAHLRLSSRMTMSKVVVLGDGSLLEQVEPGIMESGSLGTNAKDGKGRNILALCAGAWYSRSMGDDSISRGADYSWYSKYALPVTRAVVPPGVLFEFCSAWFWEDGRVEPLNWGKATAKLLRHSPDPGLYVQWRYEMRGLSPGLLGELECFAAQQGWRF